LNASRLIRSRLLIEWLIITALLAALGVAMARGQWLWRLDQSLHDIALTTWERPASKDVVIVAIDDASLAQLGRWPWRRAVHATLVERIAADKPRGLALDIILSEPDAAQRDGDALLADKLRAAAPVVLPLVIESGAGLARESPPTPLLASAATRLGLIGLELDQDGLARSVYLREGVGVARHSQLALALLEASGKRSTAAALPGQADPESAQRLSRARVRDHWYQVPFVGPPGSFTQVSYVAVLRGDMPAGFFKDKYVMVGATAIGMGDAFPTPVSGGSKPLPGVEIHANVLQALEEGLDIRLGGSRWAATLAAGGVVLLMLAFLRLSPRLGLVVTGVAALGLLLGTVLVFRFGQLWIAPSSALFVLLSAYPLWSWRRLEAAQGYLEEEFKRLSAEPALLPDTASYRVAAEALPIAESMEQRIQAVRQATERLRNLKRFVGDALDSLPDATLVVDGGNRVVLANIRSARLFGSETPAALAGRDVAELLQNFDPAEGVSWSVLTDALGTGRAVTLEASRRDDAEAQFLLHTAPAHAASGERIGGILSLIDISALKASERKRDEALRFLSHDMRAPQASILTLLEMHATEPAAMPAAKLTDRVGRYARRTLDLADEFLRLARAERVRAADFAALDLVALVDEVSEDMAPLAAARGTAIERDIGVAEAWVQGDGDLLRRALANLVSNAVKYSPDAANIRIGIARREEADAVFWALFVADRGYGIADEDLPRLFGRFSRIHREGQPEEEGVGLGLAFVKTVVTRHGGKVEVHSRIEPAAQRGSTFTLVLPALPDQVA